MAGLAYRMRYLILEKLDKAGALSAETAVTPTQANLTFSEQSWLVYLTGGMSSAIEKTRDGRYYVRHSEL